MMNIINVVGNAVLIYGAGMATGGAAISTLLSRFAADIVILRLLVNQQRELHVRKTLKIRFDKKLIQKILYIGVPNGLENGMFQLGKILVLSLISSFGTQAIAANAIATNGLGLGAIGVWIAMAVDWLFRAVVFGFRWLGGKWRLKKII